MAHRPGRRNPERLTQRNTDVAYPTPVGNRTVFYVARDGDGSGPWLWAFDLKRRDSRRASIGLEQYTSVQASADGRKLVATISNPVAGLWTVPILDRVAEEQRRKTVYSADRPGAGAPFWRLVAVLFIFPGDGRRTVAPSGRTGD